LLASSKSGPVKFTKHTSETNYPHHTGSLVPCTMFYAPEIMDHLDLSSITYCILVIVLFCFKNAKTNTTVSNNINELKEQKYKYT